MHSVRTSEALKFEIECPRLGCQVYCTKQTWYGKIVRLSPQFKNYPYVVERVLREATSDQSKYPAFKKAGEPDKFSISCEVPYFLPRNRYIRIALRWQQNGEVAEIRSAYAANNLPSEGAVPL